MHGNKIRDFYSTQTIAERNPTITNPYFYTTLLGQYILESMSLSPWWLKCGLHNVYAMSYKETKNIDIILRKKVGLINILQLSTDLFFHDHFAPSPSAKPLLIRGPFA